MTPTEPNVAAVMTRMPIVLTPDAPLSVVARTMARHDIRHVPIIDNGELVGLVSHRDLIGAHDGEKLVRDVMTEECAVTHPGASAAEAAAALLTLKIGCLPVLDNGVLVGIVTETDFVRVAYAVLAAVSASAARLHEAAEPPRAPAKKARRTSKAKQPPRARRRPQRARA